MSEVGSGATAGEASPAAGAVGTSGLDVRTSDAGRVATAMDRSAVGGLDASSLSDLICRELGNYCRRVAFPRNHGA